MIKIPAPQLCVFLAVFYAGCSKPERTREYEAASRASHDRMRLELKEVINRTEVENPFLGTRELKKTLNDIQKLPPDASVAVRGQLLSYLGWEQLNQGAEAEAIANLTESLRLLELDPLSRNSPFLKQTEGALALAYLRLAETENCCAKPNPDSCIFPLRGEAIHDNREGAEKALPLLLKSAMDPSLGESRFEAAWLANIAMMTLGRPIEELPEELQIPKAARIPASSKIPEFRNIAASAGIDTFSLSGGAIFDDFDGDGLFDLLVSDYDPKRPTRFFRNLGDQKFEEHIESSSLQHTFGGLNMEQADFDNDGDLDVFILRGAWLGRNGRHPNSLLRNDGVDNETGAVIFTDVTYAVGLGDVHYPTQNADWADFDLDGDLDLFIGNESRGDILYPCQLFRNDGPNEKGIFRFTDIAKDAGIDVYAYTKGVAVGDYDGDRYPDIFISALNNPNRLFRNLGDGTFKEVSDEKNIGEPHRSFPAWFWDYNNDGHLDIFASAYTGIPAELFLHSRGNPVADEFRARLYQNDGRGNFTDVSTGTGLTMPMLPMGCNFGDVMNDGFPDMYLGTGHPGYNTIVPNLFISNENGKFSDQTVASRLGHLQKGHAVSIADFDRDGDLDIFEQLGGAVPGDRYYDALFENPGNENGWISIRLKGTASNSYGVGAKVRVAVSENETERSVYQWMNNGGSFGANPLELHFGLARADHIDRIEVFWPVTEETQVIRKPKMNRRLVITED